MFAAEGVVVIDRHRRTDLVSIVENRRRAGLGHVGRRMADRLRMHASGIAEEASDEIEIVDGMHRDLDARQALEKGEQTPWRIDGEVNLDIDEPAEQLAIERVSHCKHHRRETQLEIDSRDQLAIAADLQNLSRLIEIPAHRLLDENARAHGHAFEHGHVSAGRRGQIENGVGRQGLVE